MIAMSIYIALVLLVWPLARAAAEPWIKVCYALTPILPLLYVLWLMAERIRRSDELEQRLHLVGLGVAAAVVSIVSLVSGFLAAAKMLSLDTACMVLLWIFPILMITYAAVRGYAARRYGGSACEEDDAPAYVHFLLATGIMSVVAAYAYFRAHDDYFTGMASGMAATLLLAAAFFWIRRRLRLRAKGDE